MERSQITEPYLVYKTRAAFCFLDKREIGVIEEDVSLLTRVRASYLSFMETNYPSVVEKFGFVKDIERHNHTEEVTKMVRLLLELVIDDYNSPLLEKFVHQIYITAREYEVFQRATYMKGKPFENNGGYVEIPLLDKKVISVPTEQPKMINPIEKRKEKMMTMLYDRDFDRIINILNAFGCDAIYKGKLGASELKIYNYNIVVHKTILSILIKCGFTRLTSNTTRATIDTYYSDIRDMYVENYTEISKYLGMDPTPIDIVKGWNFQRFSNSFGALTKLVYGFQMKVTIGKGNRNKNTQICEIVVKKKDTNTLIIDEGSIRSLLLIDLLSKKK